MAGTVYRREIDGLRAIAVLSVVLYHAGMPGISGGFVGVDVFFVISGFLITSLLLDEWKSNDRIDLVAFYARRARRLLPALWLVIAATIVASMALLQPMSSQMKGVLDSAMASLAFVANFHFAASSGGYFDGPSEEMPLLHLWSLSVEEQYYLLLPLALVLVLRRWPRAWRAWLTVAVIASFILAEYWLRTMPSAAFYQMPARFWELGLGGLVAGREPGKLASKYPPRVLGCGLALVVTATMATGGRHFPGAGALPAVAGTALILFAVHDSTRLGWAGRLLACRPLVTIGLVSYGFYLWHWPLLAFDRAISVEPSTLGFRLGLCVIALMLACASYWFVERPFRRNSGARPDWQALASGSLASLLLVGAAWGLRPAQSTTPLDELVWATEQDHPSNMALCHLGLSAVEIGLPTAACRSDPARHPEVVIWGDSHALAWQPLAWEIARAERRSAIAFTLDSCPPVVDYNEIRRDEPQHRDRCRRFNNLAMDYLASHKVSTLIMNGRWLSYFRQVEPSVPADLREDFVTGLDQALSRVSGRVARVILIAPPPQLHGSAPKCIARQELSECAMPRHEYDRLAAGPRRLLEGVAAKYPNVRLVDPAEFFCDAMTCPVMKDGYALFWDDNHVSASGARAFARRYVESPRAWERILH